MTVAKWLSICSYDGSVIDCRFLFFFFCVFSMSSTTAVHDYFVLILSRPLIMFTAGKRSYPSLSLSLLSRCSVARWLAGNSSHCSINPIRVCTVCGKLLPGSEYPTLFGSSLLCVQCSWICAVHQCFEHYNFCCC